MYSFFDHYSINIRNSRLRGNGRIKEASSIKETISAITYIYILNV